MSGFGRRAMVSSRIASCTMISIQGVHEFVASNVEGASVFQMHYCSVATQSGDGQSVWVEEDGGCL